MATKTNYQTIKFGDLKAAAAKLGEEKPSDTDAVKSLRRTASNNFPNGFKLGVCPEVAELVKSKPTEKKESAS